jgi:hypothetical protein
MTSRTVGVAEMLARFSFVGGVVNLEDIILYIYRTLVGSLWKGEDGPDIIIEKL